MEVLELKHPLQFGERRITKLEFRRLKAKDLIKLPVKPTMDDFLKMIAASTELNYIEAQDLDVHDLFAAIEILNGFFPNGPETGEQ